MYSIIPAPNGPIQYHCYSERYLASAMKNLSLTEDYPVQPVPWRQSVDARGTRRLEKPIRIEPRFRSKFQEEAADVVLRIGGQAADGADGLFKQFGHGGKNNPRVPFRPAVG